MARLPLALLELILVQLSLMRRAGVSRDILSVDGVTGCASGMHVHCVCTETLVTVVDGPQQALPTEALERAWLYPFNRAVGCAVCLHLIPPFKFHSSRAWAESSRCTSDCASVCSLYVLCAGTRPGLVANDALPFPFLHCKRVLIVQLHLTSFKMLSFF